MSHPLEDSDAWIEREKLHRAVAAGDLEQVRALVLAGASLGAFDDLGKTPLHHAAAGEHLLVVEWLLQAGADVDARDDATAGNTPLADVAMTCSLAMASRLLAAGADPTVPGWMQLTAIHRAARRRRGEGPAVHALLVQAARSGRGRPRRT